MSIETRVAAPTVLQVGCGRKPLAGALNHDRTHHADHVDTAHDLDLLPWPWRDGQFEKVVGMDVFEHLKLDVADWLGECWRILGPDGRLVMRMPSWDGPNLWRDPTHRRAFHEETFDFFDPSREFWRRSGHFYFGSYYGAPRWWTIEVVERAVNGDLCYVLRKRAA